MSYHTIKKKENCTVPKNAIIFGDMLAFTPIRFIECDARGKISKLQKKNFYFAAQGQSPGSGHLEFLRLYLLYVS